MQLTITVRTLLIRDEETGEERRVTTVRTIDDIIDLLGAVEDNGLEEAAQALRAEYQEEAAARR